MCASKLHAGDEKFHPIYRHRFWFQFLVVQSLSRVLVTLGDPMGCSTSGFPVLHHPPQFAQTQVYWISDAIHLILCCLLLFLPSIFPSIRVFSNESTLLIRWPKVLELQLQHQSFQWIFRSISFRIDWLDLLAVQGTPKSFFQYHSSKSLILWHSAFFIVQLSHLYMTTGKTIALTIWTL